MPVVFGLAWQAWEQVPDSAGRRPQPPAFGIASEQDLGHGDTDQLGVAQHPVGTASAGAVGRSQDMVVQMNVECGQKGVQVCLHTLIMGALRHARSRFSKPPSTI
jgi:hypothetical protein